LKNEGSEERIVKISFDQLKDYMRPACNACSDFTNIYADISFGGLGSEDKFTTVIPRTKKGIELINKVINENLIKCTVLNDLRKSQMEDLISKFSKLKAKRRDNYIKALK